VKRVVSGLIVLALLLVAQVAGPLSVRARDTAVVPADDLLADVLPAARTMATRAEAELSSARMDVALDPAASTIGGEMTVTWRNPARQPLSEVWFRLFPNAFYYGDGGLTVHDVTVDGRTVTPDYALDETALRVPLPGPLVPGGTAQIKLDFTTTIPADSTGSFGILNHDTRRGAWVLADWQPLLAVWEEGNGWALPPVTSLGDPTYAPTVFYDVQLTAPKDLQIAASGVVAAEAKDDDAVIRHIVAGPARDFVIVASDDQAPRSEDVDGTQVSLWTAPDSDPAVDENALDVAAKALRFYNARFGAYPAREVDLVETDPSGALGIAWSGLLFLDGPALLDSDGTHNPRGTATVIAHEVSHLWWGILVGGDSNKHGFIQEGLATVSSLLFIEETYGADAARTQLEAWVTAPARRLLAAGDGVVDQAFMEGADQGQHADAMYGKGALGFLAIRKEIGPQAFETALRDIATRYLWGEMAPDDLRAAFERASGKDLHALWSHWFNETGMTQEEIDAVAAAFAP
jgi:aminopeptidase N